MNNINSSELFKHALKCGIALSTLILAGPAFAQDSNSADSSFNSANDEIIVQARRRDESLQDVPLVVNAVTAEAIDRLNIRRFEEITTVVPGLSLTANSNGIGSTSSMRGVNQDVNVSGENGTIQFYFNDAPVYSNFALQAMYDVGQIEVLRGPQGTLRGRAAPSGSITIGARKPDLNEPGGYVNGTLASDSAYNFNFAIGTPVIADKLAIRVAGLYDTNRANRIRSLGNSELPSRKTKSIRATVRFEPVDFLRAGFVYQVVDSESRFYEQAQSFSNLVPNFTPGITQTISPPLPFTTILGDPEVSSRANRGRITPQDRLSVMTSPNWVRQNFKFYGWNAEADFAGQSLIYVGSRAVNNFRPITNQDPGATFPGLSIVQDTQTVSTANSHEIRLQNKERLLGMFDYVLGYFQQTSTAETVLSSGGLLSGYFPLTPPAVPIPAGFTLLQGVTGAFPNSTAIYLPEGKTKETSFFGNVTLHLGERTEIAGGLRRIKYVNDSAGLYISCTTAAFAAGTCVKTPGTENDFTAHATIYNATIRHRFSDDLMVYAATGSSFRPAVRAIGDFSTSYSPLEVAHTTLGNESSKSYEIGIKSDWFNKTLLVNVTAYHQKFNNYPFRAGGAGIYFVNIDANGQPTRGQFNFISAVPVRVNGMEAEIVWKPSPHFTLSSITSYADSKVGNSRVACTDALNNGTGAVGSDGIPDLVAPTLAQLQSAYGAEHLAECPAGGQSATFLPKWSGTVQAELNVPLSETVQGYVRGLAAWRGASQNDPANRFDDVGAYAIFNLYAGVRDPKGMWEVTGFVKNVFNTTKIITANDSASSSSVTYLNVANFTPFGSASYDSFYSGVSVTPPREFGINAIFRFGSR